MKHILGTIFILSIIGFFLLIIDISREIDQTVGTTGHFIIKDRKGAIITLLPKENGLSLPYSGSLDNKLVRSILSIEDRRFYSHFGIDSISKIGVLWESILAGKFTRGGSTITEQYVKNIYFPNAPRTVHEKLKEGIWALVIEWKFTKDEILKNYLETVYMGNGIYGIPAAIGAYFPQSDIENLDDESISEVITRLRFPNLGGSSIEYKKRVSQKLGLNTSPSPFPKREKFTYTNSFPFLSERIEKEIGFFCKNEKSELHEFIMDIPRNICSTPFVDLVSSVDTELSLRAINSLEAVIYPLEEKNVHNGAILVWSEKEQKILAYIGNRNNTTGNTYDMITERRSVGSILKPFLYLIALHSHDPNDFILDEAKVYETEEDGVSYVPENYIPKSYGPVALKDALGNSLNSAAVRLAEAIGIGRVYASLRSLGLSLDHDASYYGYGLVLGAPELSLENVVRGYSNLTKLGDGENFLLYDMLSDKANRSMTFGQSSILNTSVPLAVKTGTSTDFHDNWALGYNDDIVIGVWVGNTDATSMNDVSGITGAGPIFHKVAEDLIGLGYIEKKSYAIPAGIVENYLCRDESCFQKEIAYTHSGYLRKSRPASKIYYESDFVTPLSEDEKIRWKIR